MNKNTLTLMSFVLILAFTLPSHADWFTSAETKELITKADAGDIEAQFRVGSIYDTGNGAPSSRDKAEKYYRMAAEQGHAEAQNSLGSGLQAEKNTLKPSYGMSALRRKIIPWQLIVLPISTTWGLAFRRTAPKVWSYIHMRLILDGPRPCGTSPTCTVPVSLEKSIW